jgi:hypothetical protein
MRVGFAFESGAEQYLLGYSVAGTFALRGTARLGMRFDVGVQTFSRSGVNVYTLPCSSPGCASGPIRRGTGLTAVSTTASLVLPEHPRGKSSFYWLAGIGVYAVNDVAGDGAYTRFGLNAGGGFNLGHNAVFEIRYHGLIDPRTTRAFIPITLGFRF